MSRRNWVVMLFILTFASSIGMISSNSPVFAVEPSKLSIYVVPTNVPADSNVYECIFVQLQDSNSRPARAVQDTIVSLSSSLISVGDVDHTITITEGSTFAVARFYSTFTPGTTTIAATTSGYGTVQKNLVTTAPVPSRIAIYGFPTVLPSDGAQHDALVVQLQDSGGNPAKAPLQGVTVTLTSSNSTVASVPASAIISGGQTYTLSSIVSNAVGSATITAMTSGYSSATTSFTTQKPSATQPKTLRVYVAPPKTLADNTGRPQVVVELLNATGAITQSQTSITIQLTSSSESVGRVQPTLEIPAGQAYSVATFSSTYRAGVATITAAATDLTTDTETVTTIGPVPTKLVVYCSPSALPADVQMYDAIQVQLQDASGKPALDPNGDVVVSLFSQYPTIGTVPTTLIIPYGRSYATTTFTSTYAAGSTEITAQASGYTSVLGLMHTYMIDQFPLSVTVTPDPTVIGSGKQANLTAYVVDPGGNPTLGATVRFTSDSNGTFTTVKSIGNGYYTSTFTAPKLDGLANITITATASKTDYTSGTATTQITVANLGTIVICVRDDAGRAVMNATVSSLSQPSGVTTLTDRTNSTGYVTFLDAPEGNYTFGINKQGYVPTNTTFGFKRDSPIRTVYLTKISNTQPSADLTFVLLIPVAIAIIVVVVVVVMARKRARERHIAQSELDML